MTRRICSALALGAILSQPLPALAEAPWSAPAGVSEDREPRFPIPAAEYRERMSRHVERAHAHMEEHITAKQLPQDQANELRARFREAVAKINVKVEEVCADGTVTKEEAEAAHALAHGLLHPLQHD